MIKNLVISNFKLYKEEINIPLNNLNLLTGINGRGKSSVIQVFLLLSQSVNSNRVTNKIYLNGNDVKLGSFEDIKNRDNLYSENIKFSFIYDEFMLEYRMHNTHPNATELWINEINVNKGIDYKFIRKEEGYELISAAISSQKPQLYYLFDLFLNENSLLSESPLNIIRSGINFINVHYISADRIGPKNYYENRSLDHFVSVGALGENTVNIIYQKGGDLVNESVLEGYSDLFDEPIEELSKTIEDNTNYWIDKIFQGAKVQVEPIKGEDLLKLRINSDGKGGYFKPTNVGYGFSYSLPIIVAGLIAKPGEILIVENPEAHLHPHAQSIIAKFLSLVAATGVQVIIESHSEHILNGIRVSIKERLIGSEKTNVLYFDTRNEYLFEKIDINEEGSIKNWPKDFFDQSTKDLNYLLGI